MQWRGCRKWRRRWRWRWWWRWWWWCRWWCWSRESARACVCLCVARAPGVYACTRIFVRARICMLVCACVVYLIRTAPTQWVQRAKPGLNVFSGVCRIYLISCYVAGDEVDGRRQSSLGPRPLADRVRSAAVPQHLAQTACDVLCLRSWLWPWLWPWLWSWRWSWLWRCLCSTEPRCRAPFGTPCRWQGRGGRGYGGSACSVQRAEAEVEVEVEVKGEAGLGGVGGCPHCVRDP